MKRDKIIQKIKLLLETSSDEQINFLNCLIFYLLGTQQWKSLKGIEKVNKYGTSLSEQCLEQIDILENEDENENSWSYNHLMWCEKILKDFNLEQ